MSSSLRSSDTQADRGGIVAAVGAYTLWGILPIYWKILQSVDAPQILAHRIVWSFLFLTGLVVLRAEWRQFRDGMTWPRLRLYGVAAVLLGANWLIYIWAVNTGHIVDTSLGYYINPLVSVLLGTTFLRERLRPLQWAAVALAGLGVIYLTLSFGRLPWIALALPITFRAYGLLKKLAPLGVLTGLTLETATLAPAALVYLAWVQFHGRGAFGARGAGITFLLVFAGVMTSLPLLLFARAAQTVRLATLGLLQYIAPSLALVIGVFLYRESFGHERAVGFAIIWGALALYWVDGTSALRRLQPQRSEEARSS